jgi:hypothetical protein
MADTEPLPDWEREFLEKQAAEAERAVVPEKCEHAWASKHVPGHVLYWVRQCMLCHEVDWDDLDTAIIQALIDASNAMAEAHPGRTITR